MIDTDNQSNQSAQSTQPIPIPPGETRRSLISQLLLLNPNMSGAEMGRLLGCTRERVRKIVGTGTLKRSAAAATIHISLGEELRSQIGEAAEGHGSVSSWARTVLSLSVFLQMAGVDPVVVLGMKAKEVEAMKSFEAKEESSGSDHEAQ